MLNKPLRDTIPNATLISTQASVTEINPQFEDCSNSNSRHLDGSSHSSLILGLLTLSCLLPTRSLQTSILFKACNYCSPFSILQFLLYVLLQGQGCGCGLLASHLLDGCPIRTRVNCFQSHSLSGISKPQKIVGQDIYAHQPQVEV